MKTISFILLFIFSSVVVWSQSTEAQKLPGEQAFLHFIRANPDKASLQVIRNDSILVSFHSERRMPLASTVKIIIAIEYSEQVAAGSQNANELIKESDLDKYYLPNTDGGAHPGWKSYLAKKNITIQNGIPLKEVVKGMIIFSSNANAEFLMDKLGLNKINQRYQKLVSKYEPVYPIVSALLVANQFKLTGDTLIKQLRSLSNKSYIKYCNEIHQQLKNDTTGNFKKHLPALSFELQKLWSDRLPGSDAESYAILMQHIVNRNYFETKVQMILDEILQWPMDLNPANKNVYKQLGMKGGSTAFVLTLAAYAEDLNNNKTSICILLNDLKMTEQMLLQQQLNIFLINVFGSETFRGQLKKELQ